MKIKVKLFATFRENRGKEVFVALPEPVKVADVLKEVDLLEEDIAILYVNGRRQTGEYVLQEGDYLSLFPPVGGG